MSNTIIIWIVLAWFVLFVGVGQHVATVLFGAGMIGIALTVGPDVLGGLLGTDTFFTASIYSLSIVPLYLLMAQLLMRGGVIRDLFQVAYRLSGYRRFPLGVATIFTGSLLGAVSGSGAASSAALASVAAPELRQVGYTQRFSLGLCAVSGSLSAIIPPSLIMIIYGSLASVPIGHLFIGAVGPGLLCALVYVVCLAIFGETVDDTGDGQTSPGAHAIDIGRSSLTAFLFVIALMVVVFGGIYGGIVTVAEAGGLGAFASLVGMFALRRANIGDLFQALAESAKITATLMMLVLGAKIFARFLSFSRLPNELISLMEPLLDTPLLVAALLLAMFFIGGMLLESAAVIILLVPIILPLLEAANIDLLWFGVSASMMIALGLITPPVGLASFAAASSAGYPAAPVFRSGLVFAVAAGLIVTALLMVAPALVTWLPSRIQ